MIQRLTLLLAMLCSTAGAQEIKASLDRETIFAGESVLLKIDLVNPESDNRPDYSPLESQFTVLDTGTYFVAVASADGASTGDRTPEVSDE